jgi:hypothetical protein
MILSYATYTEDISLNYGNGVLTGTSIGGAAVLNGWLDLAHNDLRYVDYYADGNADSQQQITIRFKIKFNYNPSPSSTQVFFSICQSSGNATNLIEFYQLDTGYMKLHIKDSANIDIMDEEIVVMAPVAGQEYEYAICIDLDSETQTLFIDGILQNTVSFTGERSSDIGLLRIGSDSNGIETSNFSIADFVIYNTIEFTADYIPGYTLSETQLKINKIKGFINNIDGSVPDIDIKVRPNGSDGYLFGATHVITNLNSNVELDKKTGEFVATIIVEDVEPKYLIWTFGELEVKTRYESGDLNFGELVKITQE